MEKKRVWKMLLVVFIVLIAGGFFMIGCGQEKSTGEENGGITMAGNATDGKNSHGIVVKESSGPKIDISIDIKYEDSGPVAYFKVRNRSTATFTYQSNNGCVVQWTIYKKTDGGKEKVYPKSPPICTQQIVNVSIAPGEERVLGSLKIPTLPSGEYTIEGTMGGYSASINYGVK